MGRRRGGPVVGRSVPVLGTCCGALTVAAVVSALYPVAPSQPAIAPESAPLEDRVWSAVDETPPSAGPLEIPTIGVVVDDYDARYAALEAARAAPVTTTGPVPLRVSEAPQEPTTPQPPPAPPAAPASPVSPAPSPEPTQPPVVPTEPSAPPQATGEDPTTATPTPTPTTTPPPPAAEPPPTEPEVPAFTDLALGETYEKLDSAGRVLFSITLDSVAVDLACTGPSSLPAENGHLIGLRVTVLAVPTTDADATGGDAGSDGAAAPPAVGAAEFRFVGPDDVAVDDVDTDSATACLTEADSWPSGPPGGEQPTAGTIVVDVPEVTGAVVYRPESWATGLRWQL
jgi:hypothetical protein